MVNSVVATREQLKFIREYPHRFLVDMSYCGLEDYNIQEASIFPSGKIVVMAEGDSLWFNPDGISPKGSFIKYTEN